MNRWMHGLVVVCWLAAAATSASDLALTMGLLLFVLLLMVGSSILRLLHDPVVEREHRLRRA